MDDTDKQKINLREKFEEGLEQKGLEVDEFLDSVNRIRFLKIHCPWDTLCYCAEVLKIDMPVMENDLIKQRTQVMYAGYALPQTEQYFSAPFLRSKEKCFLIEDKDRFFTPIICSYIANYIVKETVFRLDEPKEDKDVYINFGTLLKQGVYIAGYPPHSGEYTGDGFDPSGTINLRCRLYLAWGRMSCLFETQPIDHVRVYFGEMYGYFFSWLALYGHMLAALSIVSISMALYGIVNITFQVESIEICDNSRSGALTMCPTCDHCSYWKLSEACLDSKIYSICDNELIIPFGFVIHIVIAIFLEGWKREEASLKQAWNMNNYARKQPVRHEYRANASKIQVNPVTESIEAVMETQTKIHRVSASIFFLLISLVVGYLYVRIVFFIRGIFYSFLITNEISITVASYLSLFVATILFIIVFGVLQQIFNQLAQLFTDYEIPKTQTVWVQSYAMKTAFFYFSVNIYYLFYTLYPFILIDFKERRRSFQEHPYREELSLAIVLIIVGNGILRVVTIFVIEKIWKRKQKELKVAFTTRLHSDYKLLPFPKQLITDALIGHAFQYSLVTCFTVICPACSIVSYFINLIIIRLTAGRMLKVYRRPVAHMRHAIGDIHIILYYISKMATIVTAFLIGYTSDFVERYWCLEPIDFGVDTRDNFVRHQLSIKNISAGTSTRFKNVTECRYRAYKYPPHAEEPFEVTSVYWKVEAQKLQFVIYFFVSVELTCSLIRLLSPGIKKSVRLQRLREAHISKKIFSDHGNKK